MLPHQLVQHGGDLLAMLIHVGVQNLVANGPHQQAGMVPVPAHPAGHVTFHIVLEKPCIVIGGLGTLPHIEGLVHHQNAHFIAQIHHLPRRRIVGGAQRVHAHGQHGLQLTPRCLHMESRPQCAQVVVQAHAVQLNMLPVEEQALVGIIPQGLEAHVLPDGLLPQPGLQLIAIGRLAAPQQRCLHLHFRITAAGFGHQRTIRRIQVMHRLCLALAHDLCLHTHRPAFTFMGGGHIHAIQRHMLLFQHVQRHITVNARAGVPAAVGTLVADMHRHFVIAFMQMPRQLRIKGRVAIAMGANHLAIHQHIAVHVHAIEPQQPHLVQLVSCHLQRPAIPAIRILIQILMIADQKIVGKRDLLPRRLLRLCISATVGQLDKAPAIVE